jgi:ribosomal protein S18 acetylase RimI-like enzyme
MIDIVPATDLGEPYRRAIADVFADGFGHDFRRLSRNRERLVDAFAHMLNLDVFWVAVVEGEPAGITALTDGVQLAVRADRAELRRHLGLIKGTIADRVFSTEFSQTMPEPLADDRASLEFVATAVRFQGRGVGTALLSYLLALPQYHGYLIESVADTNAAALHLYRKLGFTEYKRVPVGHTWMTGINAYVSLEFVQPSN